MTYPSCSCSLLAHQVRRSAEPRGVCGELWIASITKWKRDTRFFTVMSNGVVVVPCSMKPRTWKRLVLGLPWISWCTAPGKAVECEDHVHWAWCPQLKGALVAASGWAIGFGSSPSLPSPVRCLAVLDLGGTQRSEHLHPSLVSPADRLDTLLRDEDSSTARDARDFRSSWST